MNILIVDDSQENLDLLQALLSSKEYQVVTAVDGAQALAKARQNPPGLIISDILMPVMDGFALCREWKKDERLRLIPFIFCTATYTDERDREFALSLGAERFLVKPLESHVFLQTITEVIQQVQRSSAAPTNILSKASQEGEDGYLKQYNEVLIRKLETKMVQLEQTNRKLYHNITERKKAEAVLRNSEERFRGIFDNANDGILLANEETKKFYIGNNAICQMLGYSLEELKNLSVTDIHPKGDLPYVMGQFERQTRKEIAVSKDLPVKRKDGNIFYADINSSPVTLDGIKYLLGVFRDVTERKKMEEEAQEHLQELEVFYKAAVGREERIVELKKEVESLKKELGK